MTEQHNKFDVGKRDPLDERIDAVLSRFVVVEPRAGLEERVLANLRARQKTSTGMAWWHWAGVAAALAIATTLLVWRLEKPGRERIVRQPSTSHQERQPEVSVDAPPTTSQPTVRAASGHVPKRGSHRQVVVAFGPKLDQFPSPQPLSEQEKILLSYVAAYPERAVLLARLRTEELRQERVEEMEPVPVGDRGRDSERNSD
jgi:hypothetical protein